MFFLLRFIPSYFSFFLFVSFHTISIFYCNSISLFTHLFSLFNVYVFSCVFLLISQQFNIFYFSLSFSPLLFFLYLISSFFINFVFVISCFSLFQLRVALFLELLRISCCKVTSYDFSTQGRLITGPSFSQLSTSSVHKAALRSLDHPRFGRQRKNT